MLAGLSILGGLTDFESDDLWWFIRPLLFLIGEGGGGGGGDRLDQQRNH